MVETLINGYIFNKQGWVLHPYCYKFLPIDEPFPVPYGYWDVKSQEIFMEKTFTIHGGEPRTGKLLAKYDTRQQQWIPADDRLGLYEGKVYRHGYQYINGEWFPDYSPEAKALPLTFERLNMQLSSTKMGCGTYSLSGFTFDPIPTDRRQSIIDCFNRELASYRGGMTGIILAVLNPTQNPNWRPILEEVGFKLLSTHTNFMHHHPNYLYGFICMDQKQNKTIEKPGFFT